LLVVEPLVFSCSTILAVAAFLNPSTKLKARMQSAEKNHNWRNFEQKYYHWLPLASVIQCSLKSISSKYLYSAIKAKIFLKSAIKAKLFLKSSIKAKISNFPPLLTTHTLYSQLHNWTSHTICCYATVGKDSFDWTMFSFCPNIVQSSTSCHPPTHCLYTSRHRPLVWNAL